MQDEDINLQALVSYEEKKRENTDLHDSLSYKVTQLKEPSHRSPQSHELEVACVRILQALDDISRKLRTSKVPEDVEKIIKLRA